MFLIFNAKMRILSDYEAWSVEKMFTRYDYLTEGGIFFRFTK